MRINALVVTVLAVTLVSIMVFFVNQHRVVHAEPKTPHVIYGIIKDTSGNTLGSGLNIQTHKHMQRLVLDIIMVAQLIFRFVLMILVQVLGKVVSQLSL